ncbi:MAG: hypothetical protein GF365_03945 [Candidatus Buchananbacteria bacterium]|nr:hypothetical protein [Candidatus Buchananbacteria bacterium]
MNINFKQKFNMPTDQLIRRCGYGLVRDPRAKQRSYSRRLGQSGFYPRFHMYVNSEDPLILSIHIDQKQASYEGQKAHSGDYDSDLVKQEAERIYNLIRQETSAGSVNQEEEKAGFFNRLFGK